MPPEDSQLKRRNQPQTAPDLEACVGRRVLVQDHSAAVLTFKNLKITAVSAKKVLIDQANGTINKGLWAVMGASGSGTSGYRVVMHTLYNPHTYRQDDAAQCPGMPP